LQKYVDLAGTNLVSNNVEEILHAAGQGRVQYLILNSDQPWWGRFTEETGRLESRDVPGPGDTEVVNLVVLEAMKTGSKVYRLQPVDREYPSILAIYRY
jgi:hypothetical protein